MHKSITLNNSEIIAITSNLYNEISDLTEFRTNKYCNTKQVDERVKFLYNIIEKVNSFYSTNEEIKEKEEDKNKISAVFAG